MGQFQAREQRYLARHKNSNLRDQPRDKKEIPGHIRPENYYHCESCGKQNNSGIKTDILGQYTAQFCSEECQKYYLWEAGLWKDPKR